MTHTEDTVSPGDPIALLTGAFTRAAQTMFATTTARDTWQRLIELAVETIDGCDFAGTLLVDTATPPLGTDPIVFDLEAAQRESGEGPCLDVLTSGGVLYATNFADDARWPRFGPQAVACGVHSALAVQLTDGSLRGALNLYGREPDAFSLVDRSKALLLVALVEIAITSAELRDTESRRIENLQSALITRGLIGQAQGILMERERITAEQAFDLLGRASQHQNRKLRDVAQDLVDTGEPPRGSTRGKH